MVLSDGLASSLPIEVRRAERVFEGVRIGTIMNDVDVYVCRFEDAVWCLWLLELGLVLILILMAMAMVMVVMLLLYFKWTFV